MLHFLIQDPAKLNYAPPPAIDEYGQLPKLASTFDHVDGLFYFTYAVCIFFFVIILGALLWSVLMYRRKTWDQPAASNVTHNTPLEVIWTVIPLIIVMVMFAWGFEGSMDMTVVPEAAARNTYKATAKQWNWTFTYPNDPVQSYGQVWVVHNKPVQFLCESTDVLHAFYLPSMRVKRDVIPGRFQSVWFNPTELGTFHLFCAEYCGKDHSQMYAKLHVVSEAEFAKRPWDVWDDSSPAKAAASAEGSVYKALCISCHSTDGSPGTGPSWGGSKGLFQKNADGTITGREREVLVAGQKTKIVVDEAYITESIRQPMAKLVAEAPYNKGGMSAFPDLDERRIKGLIEYMKSLATEAK
jgi:cytochrome c oxidase subunit II